MKPWILTIGVAIGLMLSAQADEAPDAVLQKLDVLLNATRSNDLEQFESVCNDVMKAAMTPELLKEVSTQMSGLMEQGYKIHYMGVVDRLQAKTYYWKLTFETKGASEVLVELSIADDKAAGFFLR